MQAISRAVKTHWRWVALVLIALVPRLYLLHVYDIELSEDGFDAVNMLTTFQSQGLAAIPMEGITRFVLHPLYMILLYALKAITPASVDFYIAARFGSTLIACLAILLMFELVRREFDAYAAWIAALLLAFAPSFLWENVAILSSTLFLTLYLAVLIALAQWRYRQAALFAFLAAITRAEGAALIALVFFALIFQCARERKLRLDLWFWFFAFALFIPLTILGSSWLATGNPLAFLGAQSISSIWLRFLAPGDFFGRAAFFITEYPALFPAPIVWLGIAGAAVALGWHRSRATALLLGTSALYLIFFEALVWFNYTTLEVRFLMYPGLPLLVFAGVALAQIQSLVASRQSTVTRANFQFPISNLYRVFLAVIVAAMCVASYQQGDVGMRFIYNMMASQREMADALSRIVPPNQKTNLMVYSGNAGALDLFGRQRGLQFTFTDFRFAPDENPEQFLIDRQIQYVIYPVGNAFAKAKYPYLARFESQTHGAVTFQPLTQFATSTDKQLYSIWALKY